MQVQMPLGFFIAKGLLILYMCEWMWLYMCVFMFHSFLCMFIYELMIVRVSCGYVWCNME